MEGMLIFAGLFSAVLTAFLIESYKTLNSDPGDLTVQLLTRISEQIVASANGNASNVPLPLQLKDGSPTRAALVCNALWFLSLGLSLSCALIATLLEQWAREFLHRTDIHSAPIIRARVFTFLYYGLRRFNMHVIVDIIPFLLHLSLLLFFSGLVAFLVPVNTGIAIIAAAMLFVVATTYSVFTVFPLRYLDSPYRTPLTGLFWKLFQYFKIRRHRHPPPSEPANNAGHSETSSETMVAAISRVAAEPSEQRTSRDLKALVWTMKSLADDTELEPFVDAIPDILWGPHGRRDAHRLFLCGLIKNPQTLLHARIIDLYRTCDGGILTPTARKRRKIICYKALWTTISLLEASDPLSEQIYPYYAQEVRAQSATEQDLEVLQYASSVEAMVVWRMFENHKPILNMHIESLQRLQATSGAVDAVKLDQIYMSVREMVNSLDYPRLHLGLYYGGLHDQISWLLGKIRNTLTMAPHLILFHYLRSASKLDSLPYFFHRTVDLLRPQHATPPTVCDHLDWAFGEIVPRLLNNFNSTDPGWMDSIMDELIIAWERQRSLDGITLHPELLRYLNHRRSEEAVSNALKPFNTPDTLLFWTALANTLESTAVRNRLRDSLTAAWKVMSTRNYPDDSLISRLLNACMRVDIPSLTPSLIAALKWVYIRPKHYPRPKALWVTDQANSMHGWLATIPISSADADLSSRPADHRFSRDHPVRVEYVDALVVLYAEYLEICAKPNASSGFPHKAKATIHMIMSDMIGSSRIHDRHQIRFAHAVRALFENPACEHLRFTIIADTWLFRLGQYFGPSNHAIYSWLYNPIARDSIIATLTQYIEKMEGSAEPDRDEVVHQTRTVLKALY
ncbi:hypothetical protein R3P38DRAFT_2538489 [Favolaschia claudopus]|uniref:DUF6535 domain-containing protein n=1 Tax=Favolaschia claudopus TaxID=2862362 RepID=A0AAW0AZ51_9AGAR